MCGTRARNYIKQEMIAIMPAITTARINPKLLPAFVCYGRIKVAASYTWNYRGICLMLMHYNTARRAHWIRRVILLLSADNDLSRYILYMKRYVVALLHPGAFTTTTNSLDFFCFVVNTKTLFFSVSGEFFSSLLLAQRFGKI